MTRQIELDLDNYYMITTIQKAKPSMIYECRRNKERVNVRDVIHLWDLDRENYEFGWKSKTGTWVVSKRTNRRATLFITKLWVNENIPNFNREEQTEERKEKITEETGKFIDKYAFDNKPQSVCNGIPKTNCDELFSTSYSINQYFEKYDMYEHIFPAFESREIKRPKNISV